MLNQYVSLTKCLFELKNCNLPVIEKLKLEVQLIQMKRLLLEHEVERQVKHATSSEKQFLELHGLIRHVCGIEGTVGEANKLILLINEMKAELSGKKHRAHSVNYSRPQGILERTIFSIRDIL